MVWLAAAKFAVGLTGLDAVMTSSVTLAGPLNPSLDRAVTVTSDGEVVVTLKLVEYVLAVVRLLAHPAASSKNAAARKLRSILVRVIASSRADQRALSNRQICRFNKIIMLLMVEYINRRLIDDWRRPLYHIVFITLHMSLARMVRPARGKGMLADNPGIVVRIHPAPPSQPHRRSSSVRFNFVRDYQSGLSVAREEVDLNIVGWDS